MYPEVQKERVLVICRADLDGEIKENKPVCFLGLDLLKDLKLSVLGPNDYKVILNSIQLGVHMIAVSCVERKEDITDVKYMLRGKG
jgi:pyruvate kinase